MNNNEIPTADPLYVIAEKQRMYPESEEKTLQKDRTEIFLKTLPYYIENDDIITLNINKRVRGGKSTLAIYLGQLIFKILKDKKQQPKNKEFSMKNIARDQSEYSEMMLKPEYHRTIIVVDEDNETEGTGENATTEQAVLLDNSNIRAGEYVHTIWCSPKSCPDPNANIRLEIVTVDKKLQMTRCKLYYKYFQGGFENDMLLGICDFHPNINGLIDNWFKIKNLVEKVEITEEEKNKINELAKKDFYVDYQWKKYQKMRMMKIEKVSRTRDIRFAPIYLNVIEDMKELCKIPTIINRELIGNYVEEAMDKQSIAQSLISKKYAIDRIFPILKAYCEVYKLINQINNIKNKKITNNTETNLEIRKELLIKLKKSIDLQIARFERMKQIKEKYSEHLK